MSVVQLFLTRRNLLTLVNKLNRNRIKPNSSACTIIKQDTDHPKYPLTGARAVQVMAVEDTVYYTEREPGQVLVADMPDEEYFAGCVDRVVEVLSADYYTDKDKLDLIANIVGL